MPRAIRDFEPGVTYHMISRFVERKFFVTTQLERTLYLELQSRSLKRSDWCLLGFAVMSNHIHLAAVAGRRSMDNWLRPVHTPFADMLNNAHDRIGPVFVRGPKAFPVDNARVGHLLAYIHNNPVRANVCTSAADSKWTSHRAYTGRAEVPQGLDVDRGLKLAGLDSQNFDQWVNDPQQRADRSFSEKAHELELQLAEDAALAVLPTSNELANAVVLATADAFSLPLARLRGTSRGRAEVLARTVAAQCSSLFPMSESVIACALNVSQQRVSVLRRQIPSNDVAELATLVYERVVAAVGKTGKAPANDAANGRAVSSKVVL